MKQSPNIISYFERIIQDNMMHPSHISLYVSLFQLWSMNTFQNPFRICRKEVMKISKIKSFATYHKCINEIHNAGFIIYRPSYDFYIGSSIEMVDYRSVMVFENKAVLEPEKFHQEAHFSIPNLCDIEIYFNEREMLSDEAMQFYLSYQAKNWKLSNKEPMKCWRSAARNWITKVKNINLNQNR